MYLILIAKFLYAQTQIEEALIETFNDCNRHRGYKNLAPLKRNSALDKAAQMQADYCAEKDRITRIQESSIEKKTTSNRVKLCGYNASKCKEIFAKDYHGWFPTAWMSWTRNKKQEKVLFGNFVDIGFGFAINKKNGKTYLVGIFGTGNNNNDVVGDNNKVASEDSRTGNEKDNKTISAPSDKM